MRRQSPRPLPRSSARHQTSCNSPRVPAAMSAPLPHPSRPTSVPLVYRLLGNFRGGIGFSGWYAWFSWQRYEKGKAKGTISEHIKHIFEDGDLTPAATVRLFRTAQVEGGGKWPARWRTTTWTRSLSVPVRLTHRLVTCASQCGQAFLSDFAAIMEAKNEIRPPSQPPKLLDQLRASFA